MGWRDRLLNSKPETVGRALSKGPHGHGSMPHLSTYNRGGRILSQQDLGRGGMKTGGRVGLEGAGLIADKKQPSQTGDAKIAEKIGTESRIKAKLKRIKEQKQHLIPGGRLASRPGPHKRSPNRKDLKPLIKWLPEKAQEGIVKFADKFDEKQHQKWKAKQTKKKMQKRAKKLTAYEGTT